MTLLRRPLALALTFAASLLLAGPSSAQTTLARYSMGESFAGAVAGDSAANPLPGSPGITLNYHGSPNNTVLSANTAAPGSTLSTAFAGDGYYTVGDSQLGSYFNFGLEAWINFSSLSSTQWIALVGKGSQSGAGILYESGNGWLGSVVSGVGFAAFSTSIQTDTWYHVAVVSRFGTDPNNIQAGLISFFLNGTEIPGVGGYSYGISDEFSIGADDAGNAPFNGLIDEVRFFTFDQDTFTPAMLSYSAIPEPSTYAALVGLGALALTWWRRQQRRAAA